MNNALKYFPVLLLFSFSGKLFGQNDFQSIHQEEEQKYHHLGITAEQWQAINQAQITPQPKSSGGCNLNKIVFGWHPYWMNGVEGNYNWDLLSDLSYFSYQVNPSTGNAVSTNGWSTANVVDAALANGVRVNLCATLFDNHATFFGSPTTQQTLISNLISQVQQRGAHGVNIDFESVPSGQSSNLTNFMIDLGTQLHNAIPGSQLSIALPAVDWGGTFDVAAMNGYVDLFLIMGYDYYWNGSSQAGPTDPLYSFVSSYNYNQSRSIAYYLNAGVPREKLALAVPYYGREWETQDDGIPSATTGNFVSSRTYAYVQQNSSGNYSNPQYHAPSKSNYHTFQVGGDWRQCFVNSEFTLERRYETCLQRDIAGIGIWALGYDDGYAELWDLIEEKFTDCHVPLCMDTIYDPGGPDGDYYNNDDWLFTIAPGNSSSLSVDFSFFELENGYDTLWIYDGNDENAPLIGAFTGTNSPGTVNASGNSLSFRFISDVGVTAGGWEATYQCDLDNVPPSTQITANNWETEDFTATFTDSDNESGIAEKYYQVLDFDGSEWRANGNFGFFNDNFETTIHPEWTSVLGTWAINNQHLNQTNETEGNTNIYAPVAQDQNSAYLYHWQAKMDGSGNNRRSGIHFFCDDATQTNRGNSYFVYFRVDNNKCQIYKVENDVWDLKTDDDVIVNAGTWYDYKVSFDPVSGEIKAYQNNVLVSGWTDGNPHTAGNAISLRTGNAHVEYDDVKVYRSRGNSETVTVGSNGEARYQNPNPSTPSCRIKSIVNDHAGNWSAAASQNVNIDWTPPTVISYVNDGTGSDVDTIYNASDLSGNWSAASDPHSGLAKYWYAIGTAPLSTDLVDWTDNGSSTNFTNGSLPLVPLTLYYTSVFSENGAGLFADTVFSDGQLVDFSTTVAKTDLMEWQVYPNPATNGFTVEFELKDSQHIKLSLKDAIGRSILLKNKLFPAGKHSILITTKIRDLAPGVYSLVLQMENKVIVKVLAIKGN